MGRGREIMGRLRNGESWSGEFPVRRRDGSQLPVLVTDSPVRDREGNLVAIIGVAVDLTERKQAERDRLARAQGNLSGLPAGMPAHDLVTNGCVQSTL
jgi:hypothetical protein